MAFTFGDPGIGGGGGLGNVVFGPGGVFNTPSPVPDNSGGGPSNPSGSWLSQLLPWANLGAQTFLADQAITSPRPSTVTLLPNGQFAATGGGALPTIGTGSLSSVPGIVWIGLVMVLLLAFFLRR